MKLSELREKIADLDGDVDVQFNYCGVLADVAHVEVREDAIVLDREAPR